ncbi:Outer membrane receptor proteins, mostly Fe transport [Pedobacter westerhofensis]|uniref:Outer membrane receptor proteins, mostly Fe transport n=1 Tax=Pedobacter westerhofensis TaxID=425512 RepID=A0A521CZM7_9SPHI|nr:TonB-dependent receptor [Pedobacter westerhofensis]SMO64903.1 Outer membrane receptor proteins, mostly Fe transport [Pedobacter westerhofensis]
MKYITFFITMICSIYFSEGSYASQISVNEHPVKEVIDRLAHQYHINFMYQDGLLTGKTTSYVVPQSTDQKIEKVLADFFKDSDLSFYHVENSNYVIYPRVKKTGIFSTSKIAATTDSIATGTVTGYIYDQRQQPLSYSSVQLLKTQDTSVVKNTLCDSTGKYTFKNIALGNYRLKVSQMGYQTTSSTNFSLTSAGIHLPPLQLAPSSKQLNEVRVVAKKQFIERQIDRTIMNVENSILASSGSVNELLEIAPGVSIDNGQISMKGKQGVIVMIDDKRVKLSAAEISSLLQSMPANSIDKIELISNPSSKYDAEGKGGIINIKTKKGTNPGFNGTVTSGFIIGTRPRFSESATLNYKAGKLNMFSNYSFQHSLQKSEYLSDKRITAPELLKYNQNQISHNRSVSNNARLGADYTLNDFNTIGILGTLNDNTSRSDFKENTVFRDFNSGVPDSSLSSLNNGKGSYHTYGLNLSVKHLFGPDDHLILFNADYTAYRSSDPNTYINSYFNKQGLSDRPQEKVLNSADIDIRVYTAKVDYTYPLSKNAKFEAGAKTAYTHSNSSILFQNEVIPGYAVSDPGRTNTFDYKEYINAAYLNYITKFAEHTSFQVGVRAEQTDYQGTSITTGERFNRSYIQFFPSLFLLRDIGKDQISFSYSRRIGRPGYEDLNPFIDYSSPYFYTQGNPLLQPETTQSVEFSYLFEKDLTLGLSYSKTKNYFNYFTSLADSSGATRQTIDNFKNYYTIDLSISYNKEISSWWNMTANSDLFYEQYKTPILDTYVNLKQAACSLNLLNSLEVNPRLSFEVLGLLKSRRVVLTRRIDPRYRVDAGFKYTILKNKASLKMGITDIFYSYITKGVNETGNLYSTFYNKNENRRFNLSLNYKFGSKSTAPKKDLSNQSELDRLK